MLYFIVFVGAGLGGALRHGVNVGAARLLGYEFPFGTLIVNIVGSFLMGLLAGYFAFRPGIAQHMRLFLTTGILGGFRPFPLSHSMRRCWSSVIPTVSQPAMSWDRSPPASRHCSSASRCLGAPATCHEHRPYSHR